MTSQSLLCDIVCVRVFMCIRVRLNVNNLWYIVTLCSTSNSQENVEYSRQVIYGALCARCYAYFTWFPVSYMHKSLTVMCTFVWCCSSFQRCHSVMVQVLTLVVS